MTRHPARRADDRPDERPARRSRPVTARLLAACLVTAGVLAAGCSAAGDGERSTAAALVGGAESAPSAESTAPSEGTAAAAGPRAGLTPVDAGRRVLTAEVRVDVDDLAVAAQQVRDVAVDSGGAVGQEDVDLSTTGRTAERATLVLRVPPQDLEGTVDRVAAVGTELGRSRSSEDVESTLVDVASRIASQSASVARVQQLMDSATSLADVVALEDALTTRTAELESLRAQQAAVQGQVELATLTVVLQRSAEVPVAEPDRTGFVGGLADGWHALATTVGAGLTVLGALLPFVLVGLVLGGPLAWVLRRRARASAAVPAPPA